jgi:tRNA(Ser,Leu) C12 N-acetylase TAN1
MEINEKIIKINLDKNKLQILINDTLSIILNNINKINNQYDNHHDFISFSKIMKIYEKYRWSMLKYDYNNIKKNITKDKKLVHNISKLYGTIINYYTNDEISEINFQVQTISKNTEFMLYKFNQLKRIHDDVSNLCNNMIKNDNIIKINIFLKNNTDIFIKLYENYISIKLLNQQYKKLINIRRKLGYKIKNYYIY